MLNPRDYFEDCIRSGLRDFWTAGLPWKVVNEAIDTSFNYNVSDNCMNAWVAATERAWDNAHDPATKSLKCPACSEKHEVPWTTCGMSEDAKKPPPGLVGEGYGDGKFEYTCFSCSTTINGQFLQVAKFVKDTEKLLAKDCPMPGTVLDYKTGRPEPIPVLGSNYLQSDQHFPNRLIKGYLRSKILELMQPGTHPEPVTMDTVRVMIESAMLDQNALKQVESIPGFGGLASSSTLSSRRLTSGARIPVRKMMAHYWGNFSPFALELGGSVLRQGIFTDKMHKV